jgi:hypothetical protein
MHNAGEIYRVDQNSVKWSVKCTLKQLLNSFITNLYRPVTGVIGLERTHAADLPVLTGLNLNIRINTRVHWLLACSVVKMLTVKQEEVLDAAGCPILSLFPKKDCCTSLVTFSPIQPFYQGICERVRINDMMRERKRSRNDVCLEDWGKQGHVF